MTQDEQDFRDAIDALDGALEGLSRDTIISALIFNLVDALLSVSCPHTREACLAHHVELLRAWFHKASEGSGGEEKLTKADLPLIAKASAIGSGEGLIHFRSMD